jgi:hypothetical protein
VQETISFFKIESKINDRHNQVQNKYHQNVNIDTQVRVLDGINKNNTGIVKHIFKGSLFIYSPNHQSTAGLFVEQAYNIHVISNNII